MKKKIQKKSSVKQSVSRKTSKSSHGGRSILLMRFFVYGFGALVLVFLFSFSAKSLEKPHVLGASVYIAQGGDTSTSGGGGDTSGGGSTDINGSSGSSGGSNTASGETSGGTEINGGTEVGGGGPVNNNTTVDCIGPDGKHFTTTFKSCANLNDGWHHGNFEFTPLQVKHHFKSSSVEPTKTPEINETGNEVKPTGTEDLQNTTDDLQKINNDLQDSGVEVGTSEAHGFTIKKGDVEAETHFPLSVDPTTHTLTVTTPAGTKEVTILPDKAVQNVLQKRLLDSIENQATASGSVQKVALTEVNNEPVFQINGVSNKKVLGLFPVSFAKTAFVSTQTGQVIKVDETFLDKLLEALSF